MFRLNILAHLKLDPLLKSSMSGLGGAGKALCKFTNNT